MPVNGPTIGRPAAAEPTPATLTFSDLAHLPIWVAWCKEDRRRKDGTAIPTKVPYAVRGSGKAKADDPRTWGTRAEAEVTAKALLRGSGTGGIGLMLGEVSNGSGLTLFGIDLDSCIDPEDTRREDAITAPIAPWAGAVIERFDTCSEISPSGRGVKLFGLCRTQDMPALLDALGKTAGGGQRHGFKYTLGSGAHGPAIELYMGRRYFTVTGDCLAESRVGLRAVPTEVILDFIREYGSRGEKGGRASVGRDGTAASGDVRARVRTNRVRDESRSGDAARLAVRMKRTGATFEEFCHEVNTHSLTADWAAEKGEREIGRAWERLGNLQMSDSGKPLSNLRNTLWMLRSLPALSGIVALDEMEGAAVLLRPVPRYGQLQEMSDFKPRRLTDNDVTAILEYLQAAGLTSLNATVAHLAVDLRTGECAFHPVREYLNSLVWDGIPRLDTWLKVYLGVDDDEYTRRVGRMFLISMVARVRRPGCKVDYMLVLEGRQGAGKSAACRILGGQCFSDSLPGLHGDAVRVSQHLRGKWLIEIPEMSAMNKAESADLKAFITRPMENFTPKFGRREAAEPRQCVFVGTTNPDGAGYLKDATGGRRFWPVRVGIAVELEKLARDRDQLFAEAARAFDADEAWWPDREFEAAHAAPEQEARYEGDAWDELIQSYLAGEDVKAQLLDGDPAEKTAARKRVTLLEVARHALRMEVERIGPDPQRRIVRCLRRAGWVQRHSGNARWWEPAATPNAGAQAP